jgi:hypothetical protein
MSPTRLTLGRIVLAWFAFLWIASLVLPNLDSHARAHPAAKAIVGTGYVTLFIATPIALFRYFNGAWRKVRTVPNTTAYMIWLSLESVAALGFLVLLAYSAVLFAGARWR